jgi:hypothetical protein
VKSILKGRSWVAASLVLMTGGCASILAPTGLHVTIAAEDAVVAPERPITIHVTATNVGDRSVTWGPGSSTCQLHLLVHVEQEEQFAPVRRVCTADSRMFRLHPGESRTEVIEWDGLVHQGGELVRLAPGTYDVRGAAGRFAVSEPRPIEVGVES